MAITPDRPDPGLTILLRGHESKDLDYKAAMRWDEQDKGACCELVKDILAMANTLGGFIVIGVGEQATGFSFDGLSPEQAKTFETSRLNRFVQGYAEPPINTCLRKVNYEEKIFVIIEVPAFTDAPHLCKKDFPGTLAVPTLYVRNDSNESAAIRSPTDYKIVIERAVRNRGDQLLAAVRAILTSGSKPPEPAARDLFLRQRDAAIVGFSGVNPLMESGKLHGYLEVAFFPDDFDQSRFSLESLRAAAERAQIDYTGWPFLYVAPSRSEETYVIQDGIQTVVATKDFGNNDLLDFWRLQQSGFFYHRALLRPSSSDRNGLIAVADVEDVEFYVAQAVDCLTRLYAGLLDDPEYISCIFRITNTMGRRLVKASAAMMPPAEDCVCRIPEVVVERRLPMADWRAAIVDHAVAIATEVYVRFNWRGRNAYTIRRAIDRMFARQL